MNYFYCSLCKSFDSKKRLLAKKFSAPALHEYPVFLERNKKLCMIMLGNQSSKNNSQNIIFSDAIVGTICCLSQMKLEIEDISLFTAYLDLTGNFFLPQSLKFILYSHIQKNKSRCYSLFTMNTGYRCKDDFCKYKKLPTF